MCCIMYKLPVLKYEPTQELIHRQNIPNSCSSHLQIFNVTPITYLLREGFKKRGESVVFYQTSLGPPRPPGFFGLFPETHIFLLENASVIAETNFTFGPMFKTNLFPL